MQHDGLYAPMRKLLDLLRITLVAGCTELLPSENSSQTKLIAPGQTRVPGRHTGSFQFIRETKANVTIYTDGSATGGATAGGDAMVATAADPLAL